VAQDIGPARFHPTVGAAVEASSGSSHGP
jgi:hypothetical protein